MIIIVIFLHILPFEFTCGAVTALQINAPKVAVSGHASS